MQKSCKKGVSVGSALLALCLVAVAAYSLLEGWGVCVCGHRWGTNGDCNVTAALRLGGILELDTAALGTWAWPRELHLGLLGLRCFLALATAATGLGLAAYCLSLHRDSCLVAYFTVWSLVYGCIVCLAVAVLGLAELLVACCGPVEEADSLMPRSRALQERVRFHQARLQSVELAIPRNSDELSELPDFTTCCSTQSEEAPPTPELRASEEEDDA